MIFLSLSEKNQLDPALLKPIPKLDLSDVKTNWGEKACNELEKPNVESLTLCS